MNLTELAPDILTSSVDVRRLAISGVTADSREVRPGTLFAALPGTKVRGAAYIPDAVRAGAAAVLVGEDEDLPGDVGVPVLRDADPQRRFARLVARFYGPQPATVVAVTGTNGKTSVASFVRQIWQASGRDSASIGTVGVVAMGEARYGNMTTPDPVTLHRTLAELKADGIEHVALEASSHGLVQRRLDGLRLVAGGFTNVTRDHLDYHGTFEAYVAAKMRLFETVMEEGAAAIINLDDRHGEAFAAAARINGLDVRTVGRKGKAIRLVEVERDGFSQIVTVDFGKGPVSQRLPLTGDFQTSNALVAVGLAATSGLSLADAFEAIGGLQGAPGRLERVARTEEGAPIFVDYAHTPDALETALTTLRPYVKKRLVVVFGAGGDRDRGKRPLMGEAAARLADVAIVTDDNPRSEEPAAIRAEILAGCPGAIEIGDRAEAIAAAVRDLHHGDVLLVAGKGHETGQTVGSRVLPFSDHDAVRAALAGATRPEPSSARAGTPAPSGVIDVPAIPETAADTPAAQEAEALRPVDATPPLWTGAAFVAALGGRVEGTVPDRIEGISIDSRSIGEGEAFFAIRGDRFDGHDFVADVLANGAGVAVVDEEARAAHADWTGPLVVVEDVLKGLERLAAAARARSKAKIVAVTGSVGKTSTKEALRRVLGASGTVHASLASFNNHWGVPLTLARLPETDDFGVFEIGMNHAGEITPLTKLVRPHVAIVTTVARVHLEHFSGIEAIADAKAEIFLGLEPGGVAVINGDIGEFERLRRAANAAGARIVVFGNGESAHARLVKCALAETSSCVTAEILGETMSYRIGAPGLHLVENSLAVLATAKLVEADLALAGLAFQDLSQPKGRGRRHRLAVRDGFATLIDESYNANPESMRAAIRLLKLSTPGPGGRRIAVVGDMLELGRDARRLHARVARMAANNGVDVVHSAGSLTATLHEALPDALKGHHEADAASLTPKVLSALRPGDVVMVKGSFGSRMTKVVEALLERYGADEDKD